MVQDHQPVVLRRRQFVDAAIGIISRDGVAKATTRRIAESAGLSTASLHYCFDTKEDLFQAVYDVIAGSGFAQVGVDVQRGGGLRQGVADIVRSFARWIQGSGDVQLATYELAIWSMRSSDSRHLARRVYRRYVDGCTQLLREARTEDEADIDIEALSRMIIATLDGVTLRWLSLDNEAGSMMVEESVKVLQASIGGPHTSAHWAENHPGGDSTSLPVG